MSGTAPFLPNLATVPPSSSAKRQHGQQYTVLDRLQKLFPKSPKTSPNTPIHTTMTRPGDAAQVEKPAPLLSSTPKKTPSIDPKFLKIRLLTWNMHDSLPKGDLEELLGKVPIYAGPAVPPGAFPHLPYGANHSYHLVVVAGQECPTPSGIPMGLAASFKILDKDRDKSKDPEKEHDKPSSKIKEKHEDGKLSKLDDEFEVPTGWTSMVEDWLSNNAASNSRMPSPSTTDISSPMPLIRQRSTKDLRKGPYQLLIKDRLMGIYMAIYIHRDLKPLVRGMSKSAVTAGLIGGRVGNKGGLGISLNIEGTTFLFLNAHLAAHEGKIHHRLANLAKIKAELAVEDFLANDDPRKKAEDLTDKFDFTFLCGDLNFRLNISRLHADWLIARQDYAQALEFDQLHILMKEGKSLPGFHEALIDFPPTFKYDVLRTIRRSKRAGSKHAPIGDRFANLTEVEEREVETDAEDDMEGGSLLTESAMTSLNTRSEPGLDEDAYFFPTDSIDKPVKSSGLKKARIKLLSLLSPALITSPNKFLKSRHHSDLLIVPPTPMISTPINSTRSFPPSPVVPSNVSEKTRKLRPPPMVLVDPKEPPSSSAEDVGFTDRGVYDSSHKKRVPSWCDRILWKTTIAPQEPRVEDITIQDPEILVLHRNRMTQFLPAKFRPQASRGLTSPVTPLPLSAKTLVSAETSTPTDTILLSSAAQARPSFPLPSSPLNSGPSSAHHIPQARRAKTAFSPPSTAPLPADWHPFRRATDSVESPISPDRPQSALWRFLPAFLSPTHNQGPTPDVSQPLPAALPPAKGDVVCLNYNTLDDRGMRRLEGRSDHRPVIGTYVVYI